MVFSTSAAWLSDIAAPLTHTFGGGLTVSRIGDAVCWGYGGQSAVVELRPDCTLNATFIDAASTDLVSLRPAVAAYRGSATYTLDGVGCARMVADLVDFFSGVREPAFTFADAYLREATGTF